MSDPAKPPTPDLSLLLGSMFSTLQHWRETTRAGGVMRLSEISVLQATNKQLDMADLDRIAKAMNCNWAYNHVQRLVYFIPYELTGGE